MLVSKYIYHSLSTDNIGRKGNHISIRPKNFGADGCFNADIHPLALRVDEYLRIGKYTKKITDKLIYKSSDFLLANKLYIIVNKSKLVNSRIGKNSNSIPNPTRPKKRSRGVGVI